MAEVTLENHHVDALVTNNLTSSFKFLGYKFNNLMLLRAITLYCSIPQPHDTLIFFVVYN